MGCHGMLRWLFLAVNFGKIFLQQFLDFQDGLHAGALFSFVVTLVKCDVLLSFQLDLRHFPAESVEFVIDPVKLLSDGFAEIFHVQSGFIQGAAGLQHIGIFCKEGFQLLQECTPLPLSPENTSRTDQDILSKIRTLLKGRT
jgi:hypothetical protein